VTGTGRLTATVGRRTQRIVYGRPAPAEVVAELRLATTVDLAHVVMLAERELIDRADAAALLCHIRRLRASDFAPLHGVPTPRGLYLAYEDHLIAELGAGVGGRLHTGRSRNDLKATTTAMRLRECLLDLVGELTRLLAVLLSRARTYRDTVMPVHTHFQAAEPVTYGYYLTGVALALGRDVAAVRGAAGGLRTSPLGACAVAGTDLPIDCARSAGLLGFDAPPTHALDAVASRDVPLRGLAAAAGAALTLSRLATDLQLWSTAEFGFVAFPDRLVGGSSALPQKRNAFLLEHVKAKAGAAIGAWTATAGSIKSTPFTNSIEVGTEAMASVWPGLDAVRDAVQLAQVLVSGARPVADRMAGRAADGFVTATAAANALVRRGVPFRTAHRFVGQAVRRAVERGATALEHRDFPEEAGRVDLSGLTVDRIAAGRRAGGGPGAFDDGFLAARRELAEHAAWCARVRTGLRAAAERLDAAVDSVVDSVVDAPPAAAGGPEVGA
jgi:argininosuccinate lyase